MNKPTVTATQEVNRLFALMRENRFDKKIFKKVAKERLAAMCHQRVMNSSADEHALKRAKQDIRVWELALEDIQNGITRESDVGEPDDPSMERETP